MQVTDKQFRQQQSIDRETTHLVSMANDISANLSFHADAVDRIADHLTRFWAPRMRALLLDYANSNGADLSDNLRAALNKLQQ